MSFFGINIATQGLYTSRNGLDVSSHNIANAETKGYSRQTINQRASRPISLGGRVGMFGTGSEVVSIDRMRNTYFDYKYWNSASRYGLSDIKATHMGQIEKMFLEPSDAGFTKVINDFFNSLQDLSKNAGNDAYKSQVIGKAGNMASYYNTVAVSLKDYQESLNGEVNQYVQKINSIANQVGGLNKQIYSAEVDGQKANDLRDERDRLIDELSEIVSIDVDYQKDQFNNERLDLKINGETLVSHDTINQLEVKQREARSNPEDADGLYDVYWTNGNKLDLNHSTLLGKLKGIVEIRDGNNNDNFQATVKAGAATASTITLENSSRFDIAKAGELEIGNKIYKYTDVKYDETTKELTLEGVTPDPTDTTAKTDVADGATAVIGRPINQKGIAYYQRRLNEFVRTMAKEMNAIQKKGQLKDGNPGKAFFVARKTDGSGLDEDSDFSYVQITAENFALAKRLDDDVNNFATSYAKSTGTSDNDLIKDMMSIKDKRSFESSDASNYMEMLIAEVGTDAKKVTLFASNQKAINHSIKNQRISVSSVDLNEEAQNMVRYQQAYNVAAKMIKVFNEIMDVTVNGLI